MIGFEKNLIEEALSNQIKQIEACKISLDRKGNKYIKISKKNSKLILSFINECIARGLSKNRIMFYLCRLRKLLQISKKDFDEMSIDDIKELVGKIESSKYESWTKECYKIAIKKFFQFIKGYEWDSKQYPNEVAWIKLKVKNNNNKLPKDLLTQDEVMKMIKVANNPRDKAFISVLYESGARISEILGMKIKDITFDSKGAVIMVSGKTGDRRIRLVTSVPKLLNWLENHPTKDKKSYVWVNLEKDSKPLSYRRIASILKKVAKKAGIEKRIYPHLFRHSRATELAKYLPDAVMKHFFGWTQASKMASVYYHLSGSDVDSAILKIYGKKEEEKELPTTKICPRCDFENSPDSEFCSKCGLPLNIKYSEEEGKEKEELIKEVTRLKEELENIKMVEKKLLNLITPEIIEQLIKRKVEEELSKKQI